MSQSHEILIRIWEQNYSKLYRKEKNVFLKLLYGLEGVLLNLLKYLLERLPKQSLLLFVGTESTIDMKHSGWTSRQCYSLANYRDFRNTQAMKPGSDISWCFFDLFPFKSKNIVEKATWKHLFGIIYLGQFFDIIRILKRNSWRNGKWLNPRNDDSYPF